ncbi:MAG TPA: hypothetical protein VNM90_02325 [Haliangium sp.]|nr:hypothetical protein [Haliangium sp.]
MIPAVCIALLVGSCAAPRPSFEYRMRADLASALAFDFLGSALDRTGMPPVVRVLPTTVHDELGDSIVFDDRGVPAHTAGDHTVTLGKPGSGAIVCLVQHELTHRLDDPNDNAIRWQFEVAGQETARVDAEAGMYRFVIGHSTEHAVEDACTHA